MADTGYRNRLEEMTRTTPTVLWNDSCALAELASSIETNGAVGATCNPVIVLSVLKKEWSAWKERIPALAGGLPRADEEDLAWLLVEEMSRGAAALLFPIFEREGGRNGRLSIQVRPKLFRDPGAMVEEAERFSRLAPNMIVKIPATAAGIEAMEEATWRGISVAATVCFSVSQVVAVAEAIERGLGRREAAGKDSSTMGPVCAIMVGRLDDSLKASAEQEGIIAGPGVLDWAGVAVMKKSYRICKERGYRVRLLSAAFRNHLHWSEFIGGDLVISPPFEWQRRFNASDVPVVPRMESPVDPAILRELELKFADFRRAYDEGGLSLSEFDGFAPTRRTLRQFSRATDELVAQARDVLLPNPDA